MEFRLIVKNPLYSNNTTSILLENQQWYLSEPLRFGVSSIPNFAAISYRWGSERAPNPYYEGQEMSDQTYYALSAAIKHSHCTAFWIDALCIPIVQPARSATLGAMGFIYNLADEVIVTFPSSKSAVLKELETSDRLTDEALVNLEKDEWNKVKSIWTYDEVVNSGWLKFVSDDHVVDGSDFMDFVGYSLILYQKAHGRSSFDIHEKFPHLDALVDLVGDWHTAGLTERSAFRVMSNLDQRSCPFPENYFYAMIASITYEIIPIEQAPAVSVESLAETVMKICEQKNDFSFIFSTSERDERAGKEWRPVPGVIHSILPWQSTGDAQNGYWDKDGFYLTAMLSLKPSAVLGEPGKDFLNEFIEKTLSLPARKDSISHTIDSILLQIGFTGDMEGISTPYGFFYPRTTCFDGDEGFEILISTQICWHFGAPGLARVSRLGRVRYFPGVFIGFVDKGLASDVIIVKKDAS